MAKFVPGQVANPNGRPKGARNKKDLIAEQLTQQAITEGIMPLDFFLSILRMPDAPLGIRFECGKAAAPYVHRKMPIAIENADAPFKVLDMSKLSGLSDEQLAQLEAIMAVAAAAEATAKDAGLDPRVTARPVPLKLPAVVPPPPAPKPRPKPKKKTP